MMRILMPFLVCALVLLLVGCSAQSAATPEATATDEILLGSCCAGLATATAQSAQADQQSAEAIAAYELRLGSCCAGLATAAPSATPSALQGSSCCN